MTPINDKYIDDAIAAFNHALSTGNEEDQRKAYEKTKKAYDEINPLLNRYGLSHGGVPVEEVSLVGVVFGYKFSEAFVKPNGHNISEEDTPQRISPVDGKQSQVYKPGIAGDLGYLLGLEKNTAKAREIMQELGISQ